MKEKSIKDVVQLNVRPILRIISLFLGLVFIETLSVYSIDLNTIIQQDEITITGRVTDTNGEVLPGVNIYEKSDPTHGVISSVDGKYSIKVSGVAPVLVYSFIGYETIKITVIGKEVIDITLQESSISLDEVISIGYGTQKKVSVTGAVTSIKAEEMTQIPSSNLSNLLAGRAPGVQITSSSGFVGSTSSIEIRGKGSWNNEPPLFVIDNIIVTKEDFDALDPNEVESISFLKDAATSAIYGSRSAGGVVLVTTKTGTKQKAQFNFKGSYTTQTSTRPLQDWSAQEELTYWNDKAVTMGWASKFGQDAFDYYKDNNITGYNINDYIWRKPSAQQYNLSVNGGNDNVSYFIMGGTNMNKGSYDNTDYNRYNFRSNLTAKINKYIDINVNLSGYQTNLNMFQPGDSNNSLTDLINSEYRATFRISRLFPFYQEADGTPTTDMNAYPVKITGIAWHPVKAIDNDSYRKTVTNDVRGTFRFNLKIPGVEGLITSFLINYSNNTVNQKDFLPSYDYYPITLSLPDGSTGTVPYIPEPVNVDSPIPYIPDNSQYVSEIAQFRRSYQLNWFLNYDRTFGQHTVSVNLIYEQSATNGKQFGGRGEDLIYSRQIDQIFNTSSETDRRHFDGNEYEYGRKSYIGRGHYEFSSRYIAEFSFRYDGSYKFAPDNRWGFFPSGALGWRISEEGFFTSEIVSNLKLRMSVGSIGNDAIPPFQYINKFVPGRSFVIGDNMMNSLSAGAPANYDATWEKATVYNAGIDFGMFNERFSGQLDAFYRRSWDILGKRIGQVPTTYGAPLTFENYGEMNVKGIDFSIRYRNKVRQFDYHVGVNLGYAIDKILVKDEPAEIQDTWRSQIGQPLSRLWGFETDGLIRDQAMLDQLLADGFTQFNRDPMLGVLLYKDVRGSDYTGDPDGNVDIYDMNWISNNGKPRINYGLNMGGAWKGISVEMLFQGVGKYDKMITTLNSHHVGYGGVFQLSDAPYFEIWAKDHWSPDNPDAKYPRAHNTQYPNPDEFGFASSQFWIRKGAYVRLKNLNVAYSLPKTWVNKISVDQFQIFFNGVNLFEISDIPEMDPEQYMLDSYPIMKSYTFGVNLTF